MVVLHDALESSAKHVKAGTPDSPIIQEVIQTPGTDLEAMF